MVMLKEPARLPGVLQVWKKASHALGRARAGTPGLPALPPEPLISRAAARHSDEGRDWHILTSKFLELDENITPDFECYDLASTTARSHARNWHFSGARRPMAPLADAHSALRQKTKFCAFVAFSSVSATRQRFVEILSRSMRVEVGGRVMRSVSYELEGRFASNFLEAVMRFYRPYKFVVAFENSLALDYASEKLWAAIHADTVPIYWGNPHIANYFNPERFINAFDFDTLESLARHVMRVHEDDELYLRYLSAPSQTSRQKNDGVVTRSFYQCLSDMNRDFFIRPKAFFASWQQLRPARRKGFFDTYLRLVTGRKLPLAQRRMFHRECLSRFADEECRRIFLERSIATGVVCNAASSGRQRVTRWQIWPHPAFYEVVDMHGRLDVRV